MQQDLSISTATKVWRSVLFILQVVFTSLCATLALGGLVYLFLWGGPSDDPFRARPWVFYLFQNDKQGTLILLGCVAALCSVFRISRYPGHLWDKEPGLVTGFKGFGKWVRGLRMRQVAPVLIGLLSISGILATFVIFFRGVEFGKNDFEACLQFAFALGVLVWAANILHSKWQSPDFAREIRRPLCTCALSFIFILFPSWWTGVPLGILIFVVPIVNDFRSKWDSPKFAWESTDTLGFLVILFIFNWFPYWWGKILWVILFFVSIELKNRYLRFRPIDQWPFFQDHVLSCHYDNVAQQENQGREVQIWVPASGEEILKRREVKE